MWSKPQAHKNQTLFPTFCHYHILFSDQPQQMCFQEESGFSSGPPLTGAVCCYREFPKQAPPDPHKHAMRCGTRNRHVGACRRWSYQLPHSPGLRGHRSGGSLLPSIFSFSLSCKLRHVLFQQHVLFQEQRRAPLMNWYEPGPLRARTPHGLHSPTNA